MNKLEKKKYLCTNISSISLGMPTQRINEEQKRHIFDNGFYFGKRDRDSYKNLVKYKEVLDVRDNLLSQNFHYFTDGADIFKVVEIYCLKQEERAKPKRNFKFDKSYKSEAKVTNKGFCFKTMKEVIKKDISKNEKKFILNKTFKVKNIDDMKYERQVVLRGLPIQTTKQDIFEQLGVHGTIMSIKHLEDKRLAFVSYTNKAIVTKVIGQRFTFGHLIITAEKPRKRKN